jgi:hypothetical protein
MEKGSPTKSEGVRIRDGRRYAPPMAVVRDYGIPRYRVFEMLKNKEIRSTTISRKNSKRHLRLIDLDSLESYLDRFATEAKREEHATPTGGGK